MDFEVAERMKRLPAQFFAGLVQKVGAQVRAGRDVINLGQGNPDLPTPAHIVEALREAALDPLTHKYAPFTGLPVLKEAVASFYLREYGVELNPESEVAVLFGGKTGLVELAQVYLNAGDVALVPDPGYPDYWSGVALAGGRMVTMPLLQENRFLPDFERLTEEELASAKMMFLNYPNNPTGAIADEDFYASVVRVCESNQILCIHDFAYGAIGFDGNKPRSFLQTAGAKEVGIEIYTMSKTFNMAGWRIAFAVGNQQVIEQINLIQDHYYVSLFGAIQKAGVAALTGPADCIHALVGTYESRRNALMDQLEASGLVYARSGGSFFCWLPVPTGLTSVQYADQLLYQADVAVAPGVGFGRYGEGFVRLGLLAPIPRLREAAQRIAGVTVTV